MGRQAMSGGLPIDLMSEISPVDVDPSYQSWMNRFWEREKHHLRHMIP
jgi:hypothetical protein